MVDDDAAVLRALEPVFRYEGYEVVTTTRGMDAIGLARRLRFDFLLVDLVLPDVDGLTVLRYARTFTPDACVIILTGHVRPEWDALIRTQGAAAVFSKPPVMSRLLRFLQERRGRALPVAG
jgi:DNA-binding response OmpR family regulator